MDAIKGAFLSKTNWKSVIAMLAMLLAFFGFDLTPEDQAAILALIVAASEVLAIIIRFFTKTSLAEKVAE